MTSQAPDAPTARPAPRQRATKQRAAVDKALASLEEFVSAQQLHDVLRRRGETVGLATVYRTLQSLVDSGDVDTLRTEDGESLYRRCEQQHHHHHLLCRECRATVEVDGPDVEAWAAKVAEENGFTLLDHTVELTGVCAQCQTGGEKPSR